MADSTPAAIADHNSTGGAESVFVPDGEGRYTPTEYARGPWDPRAQHGGAPATLIAGAFERMQPGGELPLARLSFSFLRPVPLAPLRLSTRIVRPGRRVQELEAQLRVAGPQERGEKEGEEGGSSCVAPTRCGWCRRPRTCPSRR